MSEPPHPEAATDGPTLAEPGENGGRLQRAALQLLALNALIVLLVFPLLFGEGVLGEGPTASQIVTLGLSFAIWCLLPWASTSAPAQLFCYPLALVLGALGVPTTQGLARVAGTLALFAYAAVAAAAVTRPRWKAVSVTSLAKRDDDKHQLRAERRAQLRTMVASMLTLGAAIIAVIVPAFAFEREDWPAESADASATFAAVSASVLGIVVVGAMGSNAMRAPRKKPAAPHLRRAASLAIVTVFGLLVYAVVRSAE